MIVAQEFDHPPWITHPIVSKALEKGDNEPSLNKACLPLDDNCNSWWECQGNAMKDGGLTSILKQQQHF